MEYLFFSALLRTSYNNINEYGEAVVVHDEHAVDFVSDFVPLVPLGTQASIDWTLGKKSLASCKGKVYLSTQNMLRLVEVDPELVERARATFASNISIPGFILVTSRQLLKQTKQVYHVTIVYLSVGMVKLQFSAPLALEIGEKLMLDVEVDFLSLHGLSLKVRQIIQLGFDKNLLICEVERSGNDNYVALSTYASRLDRIGQ